MIIEDFAKWSVFGLLLLGAVLTLAKQVKSPTGDPVTALVSAAISTWMMLAIVLWWR